MKIFWGTTCVVLSLLLMFSGCSKEDSKQQTPVKQELVCHIASYSSNWYMGARSGNPATDEFTFDAQERIILAPTGSYQISFEYYPDQIILKYANEAPNTVTDYYTLNDKKQIIHLVRKARNTYWGDTELKDYLVLDFVYNDEGYLTAIKEGDKQVIFTYSGGNLINIHDMLNNQNANYACSYNTDQPYQALPVADLTPIYHIGSLLRSPTPINNPYGMAVLTSAGYFGKLPKLQVKSIGTYTFAYSKNEKQQITKLKSMNADEAIDSTVYKFEYLCK